MLKGKQLIGLVLVAMLAATFVPFSTQVYAQDSEEKRVEKFIELAERAGERVGNLIELIYSNETAIATIENVGLRDELEANKTLFENWGLGNLTAAYNALDVGDLQGAVANATEALGIFREVFKALNNILEEAGLARGMLIDAQGLIEAMKRAIDRIERIREVAPPEVLADISAILESAERYLNISAALIWLSQGRVNETAWNLTQANQLISLAYSSLKRKAGELNIKRIGSYLKVIGNLYDKNERLLDKALEKGLPGADALKTELESVKVLIDDAGDTFAAGDYSEAITKLVDARNMLKWIERELSELRRQS